MVYPQDGVPEDIQELELSAQSVRGKKKHVPIYDHAAHQAALDDMGYIPPSSGVIDDAPFFGYPHSKSNYFEEVKPSRFEAKTKIIIPYNLFREMVAYAQASSGEISGFAKTAIKQKDGITTVSLIAVRIFQQVINPVHTRLYKADLHPFHWDLVQANENPARWNCWWHSHNDFGVFFSGEDQATIRELSSPVKEKNSTRNATPPSHLFSVCVNKAGDVIGRHDFGGELVANDVAFIDHDIDPARLKEIKREVKQKVTVRQNEYRPKAFRGIHGD